MTSMDLNKTNFNAMSQKKFLINSTIIDLCRYFYHQNKVQEDKNRGSNNKILNLFLKEPEIQKFSQNAQAIQRQLKNNLLSLELETQEEK